MDRWTDRQTDRQAGRQTDGQTDIMSTARHSPLRTLPEANHWLWVMHGISTKRRTDERVKERREKVGEKTGGEKEKTR